MPDIFRTPLPGDIFQEKSSFQAGGRSFVVESLDWETGNCEARILSGRNGRAPSNGQFRLLVNALDLQDPSRYVLAGEEESYGTLRGIARVYINRTGWHMVHMCNACALIAEAKIGDQGTFRRSRDRIVDYDRCPSCGERKFLFRAVQLARTG